jgi:hypothetical protein
MTEYGDGWNEYRIQVIEALKDIKTRLEKVEKDVYDLAVSLAKVQSFFSNEAKNGKGRNNLSDYKDNLAYILIGALLMLGAEGIKTIVKVIEYLIK